jgi:hypothetical protein
MRMRRILPNEFGRGEPNDIYISVLFDVGSRGGGLTSFIHIRPFPVVIIR